MKSLLLVSLVTGSAIAAELVTTTGNLTVHEWGTFTSVAGESGEPTYWAPLADSPDLPCFVDRLSPFNIKALNATVRMETPVIYFYAAHDTKVSVRVTFPQGWITEWYPRATEVKPKPSGTPADMNMNYRNGAITWDDLAISPGQTAAFPRGKGASRYYAARETDSAVLSIGGMREKMIFYRGIGNFEVPLRAVFDSHGTLDVRNISGDTVAMVLLFENRDGRAGFRMVRDLKASAAFAPPELNTDSGTVRETLAHALIGNGLYPKEAAAMIETWHDSWFEEGTRLMYIVPHAMLDSVLPLQVSPAPAAAARVFVGRIELLSPAVRAGIQTAVTNQDVPALKKYGRFLQPFAERMNVSAAVHHLLSRVPAVSEPACIR